ncbi:MAG: hypothetical protein K6F70_08075 [Eggerthellaceae bacterium]|nr:hypothetical protein [Eggerthellaceae bacterium]
MMSRAMALYNSASEFVVQDATAWASLQDYALDADAARAAGDSLALDAAAEAAYGVDFGGDEEKIVAHLFKLYTEKTAQD